MEKVRVFLAKQKAKAKLRNAFNNAGIYDTYKNGDQTIQIYPVINYVDVAQDKTTYIFNLINGMDPKELRKKEYVFKQHFGTNIKIEGDLKKHVLTIFHHKLPKKVNYDYKEVLSIIEKENFLLPIVCGYDYNRLLHMYDATGNPNLLIFGQPGSGKSSILHVIISTLIQYYSPDEINFYLGDLKMAEFGVYEGVQHVKSVNYLVSELKPSLNHVKKELTIRGALLKKHGVRHINKVPKNDKRPYIVVCIDEFVMIDDEEVMKTLLQIASLGRAYGIYIILSMQRPSHKILSTDVRGVLDVRMGFRTVDVRNAMIGDTPGSEKIKKDEKGKFLLRYDELVELKAPFLDEQQTEKILSKYKSKDWINHSFNISSAVEESEVPEEIIIEKVSEELPE